MKTTFLKAALIVSVLSLVSACAGRPSATINEAEFDARIREIRDNGQDYSYELVLPTANVPVYPGRTLQPMKNVKVNFRCVKGPNAKETESRAKQSHLRAQRVMMASILDYYQQHPKATTVPEEELNSLQIKVGVDSVARFSCLYMGQADAKTFFRMNPNAG